MKPLILILATALTAAGCGSATSGLTPAPTPTVTVTRTATVQAGLSRDAVFTQCYQAHESERDADGMSPPAGLGDYCHGLANSIATNP
jgi:hypothetical protein